MFRYYTHKNARMQSFSTECNSSCNQCLRFIVNHDFYNELKKAKVQCNSPGTIEANLDKSEFTTYTQYIQTTKGADMNILELQQETERLNSVYATMGRPVKLQDKIAIAYGKDVLEKRSAI